MPSITLKDIQEAADKKYGDFEIHLPGDEIVSFVPALRLPKAKRLELRAAFNAEKRVEANDEVDVYDIYQDVFKISSRQKDAYDKLAAAVGDDPAVWEELAKEFMQDSATGEA
jgi:hypothetical protein